MQLALARLWFGPLLYSFAFKFFEMPLKLSISYSELIFRAA